MRVQFQISGGIGFFPGLAAPRTIDVDTLTEQARSALTAAIGDSRFFDLPAHIPAAHGSADHHTYRITVADGSRRHTVVVSDPVEVAPLQRLIELLRTL